MHVWTEDVEVELIVEMEEDVGVEVGTGEDVGRSVEIEDNVEVIDDEVELGISDDDVLVTRVEVSLIDTVLDEVVSEVELIGEGATEVEVLGSTVLEYDDDVIDSTEDEALVELDVGISVDATDVEEVESAVLEDERDVMESTPGLDDVELDVGIADEESLVEDASENEVVTGIEIVEQPADAVSGAMQLHAELIAELPGQFAK